MAVAFDAKSARLQGELKPVTFHAASVRGTGWLTNVSETGAFVRTGQLPPLGDSVRVRLEANATTIAIDGKVRWRGRRSDTVDGFKLDLLAPPADYVRFVRQLERREIASHGVEVVSPRVPSVIPVAVESANLCDSGIIRDISMTGAQLSDTRVRTEIGASLILTLVVKGKLAGFDLPATVVRRTAAGSYAVRFDSLDLATQDSLAELLTGNRSSGPNDTAYSPNLPAPELD